MLKKSKNKSAGRAVANLLPFILALSAISCSTIHSTPYDQLPAEGYPSITTPKQQSALRPLMIAIFDDKSGSASSARITPLSEQDLVSLINRLRLSGGELAFGLIGESTDRPLLRLRIQTPPTQPKKTELQNPFEQAEEDSRFQERDEKYRAAYKQWEDDISQRVNVFLEAVRPRLQERASAKRSPVNSAISRSELFLNEPETAWPGSPLRFIILNSDALDTTKTATPAVNSGATLILINGSGSLGIFKNQHPLRFESIQSALDYIVADETGRSK